MKSRLVVIGVVMAGCVAAQTKISGTGKCGKAENQSMVEVGDRAGHKLVVLNNSCTWPVPLEIAGVKAKSYTVATSSDSVGDRGQDRGYVVVTMENGDKAFVKFQGTGTHKASGAHTDEGTWTFTGGTGMFKGLKGKGTYKGTGETADVTDDQIDGEYMLGETAAKAKKD